MHRIDCSVIVPVKNEAGNIARAFSAIPELGEHSEIIFVYGESNDGTWEILEDSALRYDGPHQIVTIQQSSKGKWNAVQQGLDVARGNVLVILDGDLTVCPSELVKFYEGMESGVFINGTRMIYPMETGAMRRLNHIGNRVFAKICSLVTRQRLTDSLCGTKMIMRCDWSRMKKLYSDLIERDPFGDHALLYGASRLGLTIKEIPVHYRARTYGSTKISRFSDGWQLLKLAAWEIRQTRGH